jgi:DNA-binding transcriptional ArsR family regulator
MNEEMLLKTNIVAEQLKILSHEGRLKLLCLLSQEERNVSELQELTNISQSQISQYLRQFERSGLVESKKEGKWSLYKLKSNETMKLIKSLQQIYCDKLEE